MPLLDSDSREMTGNKGQRGADLKATRFIVDMDNV